MGECNALGFIREARALLHDEAKDNGSRELSMVLTKLDEAELWRQRDMQLKTPIRNDCAMDDGVGYCECGATHSTKEIDASRCDACGGIV
jgi:hypothetical protein